ncbi:GH25 family lysozyme [Roseivirga sp. E12]|uniref:GH25 family lysozyme n=1 Tax=Roseivirga sp. E12 TaxID=2819237 RepID=UPI001ABC89E2|nr:GH25 family lysozyme [Roseivirga sp. E12]MBO3700425.1 peptidoglycan-binding protein [Roseivirga sp. E12]
MLLKIGSQGQQVKDWQNFLNTQGLNAGAADGIFGSGTAAATKGFQSAQGLSADGMAGNNTIAAARALGFQFTANTFPPVGNINAVVDISHFQSNVDFAKVKADGLLGVIHKATQGASYTDPEYASKRVATGQEGLLWGAYHFGTAQDVSTQVSHFLQVAAADANTLLVLDWEENAIASQGTMTLPQAVEFVERVKDAVGRYPVLYGGSLIKQSLGSGNNVLSQCPLWLAQYSSNPSLPSGWSKYTMWQYTDGVRGPEPHSVNGIGNCDRDVFAGTASELKAFWKSGL